MAVDALTVAAVLVSVLVLVAVVLVMRRAARQTEQKLRSVAEQSVLISSDHPTHELCEALRELYPDACPGLDYLLAREPDGTGAYIKEWNLTVPRPTGEQIERALSQLKSRGSS